MNLYTAINRIKILVNIKRLIVLIAMFASGCTFPGVNPYAARYGRGMSGLPANEGFESNAYLTSNSGEFRPSGGVPMRGPGMNQSNADDFAHNVIKLKVGQSTKREVEGLLGSPSLKGQNPSGETWNYVLQTGQVPGHATILFNKLGILKAIKVQKIGVSGGSVNMEDVYNRGDFNPF